MQPHTPPDRIRQAIAATGYIEDHAQALAVVQALNEAGDAAAALAAGRHAAAFLAAHMAEEEASDGVFHWIVALDGGLAEEVDRLVAQPAEVRAATHALVLAPEAEAVSRARQLADLLEEHEAAERAALDRAVHAG
jgi:hypothetical protein